MYGTYAIKKHISDACAAGTYRSSNKSTCNQCEGESISYEGAASCTPCAVGESANSEKTECGAPASNSDSTGYLVVPMFSEFNIYEDVPKFDCVVS